MPTNSGSDSECWCKKHGEMDDFCISLKKLFDKCKVEESVELSKEEEKQYASFTGEGEDAASVLSVLRRLMSGLYQ
jgi:hypothetical protein